MEPDDEIILFFSFTFQNMFFSKYGIESLQKKVFNFEYPVAKCKTASEAFQILMQNCSHTVDVCSEIII